MVRTVPRRGRTRPVRTCATVPAPAAVRGMRPSLEGGSHDPPLRGDGDTAFVARIPSRAHRPISPALTVDLAAACSARRGPRRLGAARDPDARRGRLADL